jgi:hypothetical protein
MWMQVLRAGGLQVIGNAFPSNWESTIREANPHGFFESMLTRGIFHRTNPHPTTGGYLFPELAIAGAVVAADTYLTTSCWNSYGNRICSTYSTADWDVAGPLLGVGLATVVTGSVILGINIGRRKKAGMPRAKVRVAPTHTGWTGSLTMAF